jgi:hypothetical protein
MVEKVATEYNITGSSFKIDEIAIQVNKPDTIVTRRRSRETATLPGHVIKNGRRGRWPPYFLTHQPPLN